MDPVLNKPATTPSPLSQDLDADQDSPLAFDDEATVETSKPTPPKPVPPPLPNPDDDLVKPGAVDESVESAIPKPEEPPAPQRDEAPMPAGIETPPPPPPPIQEREEPPLNPAVPPTSTTMDTKGKVLLAAGPLFLVASLVYAATTLLSPGRSVSPGRQRESYPVMIDASNQYEDKTLTEEEYAQLAPIPPTTVRGYADRTKSVELQPVGAYFYPNPYFEWTGAEAQEPGTSVFGYIVYFGPLVTQENLQQFSATKHGNSILANSFSPQDFGITLEPGVTYRLIVQPFTNGRAKFGYDRDVNAPSKIYFEYTYQP